MTKPASTFAILLLALAACACDKKETASSTASTGEPATAAATPEAAAKKYFAMKCEVCHGKTGAGDGAGAAALNPKPANFADAAWQGGVTDEHIAKVIVEGGAAAGKSATMPPNPDLKGKDDQVKELVKLIRGFKK